MYDLVLKPVNQDMDKMDFRFDIAFLRGMGGDIDWYFPSISDFQMANKLMAIHGEDYRIQSRIDTDYRIGKVPVEHHRRLINMYNPFVQKFISMFEMEERSSVRSKHIAKGNIQVPL